MLAADLADAADPPMVPLTTDSAYATPPIMAQAFDQSALAAAEPAVDRCPVMILIPGVAASLARAAPPLMSE